MSISHLSGGLSSQAKIVPRRLPAGAASQLSCPATLTQFRLLRSRVQSLPPPFQLVPSARGSLDALKPVRLEQSAVRAGQTQVAVSAVGLNFRDVLNVLDMYPGDPGLPGETHPLQELLGTPLQQLCELWIRQQARCHAQPFPITSHFRCATSAEGFVSCTGTGSDFAGTVLRCGPEQQASGTPAWQAGDAVMGLATGCLATAVVAERGTAARVAPAVALAAAASLPTVAVTAEAAFALTGLRRGMR